MADSNLQSARGNKDALFVQLCSCWLSFNIVLNHPSTIFSRLSFVLYFLGKLVDGG